MGSSLETALREIAETLRAQAGEQLYSCCVYGSAVRGNAIEGVSDLNLLLVLESSTAESQQALARAIAKFPAIDPFITDRQNFPRDARCFAAKFASIRRHHRVLLGADPFEGVVLDEQLERLLCEQALRNTRLRLTYAFVMRGRQRDYGRHLRAAVSPILVQLSEILRLQGRELPTDFAARTSLMEEAWNIDGATLRELLVLRERPHALAETELVRLHERVLTLLETALQWIARHWETPAGGGA